MFTARFSFEEGVRLARNLTSAYGVQVLCARSSVSNRIEAASIGNWVRSETDSLDLLICSASTFRRLALGDTMQDHYDDLMGSNLHGPYFLAQQCQDLLTNANGSIINISDAQVNSGLPGFSAYLAAKAGLVSITKSLALELAPKIRVNAILPGSLPWPDDATYDDAEIKSMTSQIPMQRIGTWGDVVGAVEYLQSATYVTGSCLPIDGGRAARY